jgi:hypothetical protein
LELKYGAMLKKYKKTKQIKDFPKKIMLIFIKHGTRAAIHLKMKL